MCKHCCEGHCNYCGCTTFPRHSDSEIGDCSNCGGLTHMNYFGCGGLGYSCWKCDKVYCNKCAIDEKLPSFRGEDEKGKNSNFCKICSQSEE